MNFSEENLTSTWLNLAKEQNQDIRACHCCDAFKITKAFNGIDNTCKLCRKLQKLGLRYSHKITMSKDTILDHVDGITICLTCKLEKTLDEMALHGLECTQCWLYRGFVELAHYVEIDMQVECLVCSKPKDVKHFPSGRLTCKSCICMASEDGRITS